MTWPKIIQLKQWNHSQLIAVPQPKEGSNEQLQMVNQSRVFNQVAYQDNINRLCLVSLSLINTFMIQSTTRNWCYICQKQFGLPANSPPQCPTCHQSAFQQITPQSHPQLFTAYQPNPQSANSQPSTRPPPPHPIHNIQVSQLMNPLLGLTNFFTGTIQTLSNTYGQNPQSLGTDPNTIFQNSFNLTMANTFANLPQIMGFTNQIANFFMQNLVNSGQSYRPASQQEIGALAKVAKPHDCAICQTDNDQEGFKLKCGHQFHSECILPWFHRANTCPTCRDTL